MYIALSKYTKSKNITLIKLVEIKDFTFNLISKFWNESCLLTPPPLSSKPFALMQSNASTSEILAYWFERSQILIDTEKYFNFVQKNIKKEIDLIFFN